MVRLFGRRVGNQTLIGGTATTGTLTLQGTSGNGDLPSPAVKINVGNNGATNAVTVLNNGNVGIGTTAPLATLHIGKAGTAAANTAPLKFTAGTALTTPEAGAIDYVTSKFKIQNDSLSVSKAVITPQIKSTETGDGDLTVITGPGKTLVLATPVWDDLQINIDNAKLPAADAPDYTAYKGGEILRFKKDATNSFPFKAQLSHRYKEGSDIEFHVHIIYPTTGAGNSRWRMTYSWANRGQVFAAETTTTAVTLPASGVADEHTLGEIIASISGAGKTVSSGLICTLTRLGADGADTYDDYVYLFAADFHYQIDTEGSRTGTTK